MCQHRHSDDRRLFAGKTWHADGADNPGQVTLGEATRGQPLMILGVAMDTDPQGVRDYMARNGYSFPVTLDPGGLRARFTRRRVIPMTCIVDRQGRFLQAIPGEMFEDDVMALGQFA